MLPITYSESYGRRCRGRGGLGSAASARGRVARAGTANWGPSPAAPPSGSFVRARGRLLSVGASAAARVAVVLADLAVGRHHQLPAALGVVRDEAHRLTGPGGQLLDLGQPLGPGGPQRAGADRRRDTLHDHLAGTVGPQPQGHRRLLGRCGQGSVLSFFRCPGLGSRTRSTRAASPHRWPAGCAPAGRSSPASCHRYHWSSNTTFRYRPPLDSNTSETTRRSYVVSSRPTTAHRRPNTLAQVVRADPADRRRRAEGDHLHRLAGVDQPALGVERPAAPRVRLLRPGPVRLSHGAPPASRSHASGSVALPRDPHLEMQVRPGGVAGLADPADHLSSLDHLPQPRTRGRTGGRTRTAARDGPRSWSAARTRPPQPEETTRPPSTARIGVPVPAEKSSPVWQRAHSEEHWPNRAVSTTLASGSTGGPLRPRTRRRPTSDPAESP